MWDMLLSERKQISLKSAVADTYFIKIRPVKKNKQVIKIISLTWNTDYRLIIWFCAVFFSLDTSLLDGFDTIQTIQAAIWT